jgi:hypothetical protein
MPTPPLPVWTAVDSPVLIQCLMEWHMENKTPLKLMIAFRTDPLPAHILGVDDTHMLVLCAGLPSPGNGVRPTYTVSGKSSDGNFLATGQVARVSASGGILTLRLPERVDVGQPDSCQQVQATAQRLVTNLVMKGV